MYRGLISPFALRFFFSFVGNFALIGSPAQDGGALFVGAPID